MEASFWHQKWESDDIKFHKNEANVLLVEHFEKLKLSRNCRIFLPLCGKTLDFLWLLSCNYRVVGAELSELAINELFDNLGVEPKISRIGELTLYQAKNIDIFVGDIFDLSAEFLGLVDAVYDRAALVALPKNMRDRYTSHLMKITKAAPQLLITYEYNQQLRDAPPFSVTAEEVRHHYAATYQLKFVKNNDVSDRFNAKIASIETVWLLHKSNA